MGNQLSEPKLLGTRNWVPDNFRFGYGSASVRPEILGTQTESSFGSGTRTMNTPTPHIGAISPKFEIQCQIFTQDTKIDILGNHQSFDLHQLVFVMCNLNLTEVQQVHQVKTRTTLTEFSPL